MSGRSLFPLGAIAFSGQVISRLDGAIVVLWPQAIQNQTTVVKTEPDFQTLLIRLVLQLAQDP